MITKQKIAAVTLSLGIFLGLLVPAPKSMAVINTDEDLSVDVTNCSFEYYSTLFDYRYKGSSLSYFSDIWQLSYCQVFDVLAVYDELEQVREDFKARARACQDTSGEYDEYKRLMMEVYFIRNVWPYQQGVIRLQEVEQTKEELEGRIDKLEELMIEKFVYDEEYVSETKLRAYFEDWKLKYKDRIADSYIHCNEGPWAEVVESADNFIETMEEIGENFEKIPKMWEEMRAEQREMISEIKNVKKNFSGLKPKVNFQDAQDEFKAWKDQFGGSNERASWFGGSNNNNPTSLADLNDLDSFGEDYTNEVTTLDEALKVLDQGDYRQALTAQYNNREARYQKLYGQNGSMAAQDLAGSVKQINRIVESDSQSTLPKIRKELVDVYGRQCKE